MRVTRYLATALLLAALASPASSLAYYWDSAAGGSWQTGGNWYAPGQAPPTPHPGSGDRVVFGTAFDFSTNTLRGTSQSSPAIGLSGNASVLWMTSAEENDASINLGGHTLSASGVPASGISVHATDGALQFSNGNLYSAGRLTAESFDHHGGPSAIHLLAGASVSAKAVGVLASPSSPGAEMNLLAGSQLTIRENGSWRVGSNERYGHVVASGATIHSSSPLFLSNGTVRLEGGTNAAFAYPANGTAIQVGAGSHGDSLILTGGGTTLSVDVASPGNDGDPNRRSIHVGFGGTPNGGQLLVEQGAALASTDTVLVATKGGIRAFLTVEGAGSSWQHTGAVIIAPHPSDGSDRGTIQVLDGASSTITGQVFVGLGVTILADDSLAPDNNGGLGEWLVGSDGSRTEVDGTLYVGAKPGSFNAGSGLVDVSQGGTLDATRIEVSENGLLMNSGHVRTQTLVLASSDRFENTGGSVSADLIQGSIISAGTIAPGQSTGLTEITGDYTQQAAGTLAIEIGGLERGTEHDAIVVAGSANLAGELEVTLIEGFSPSAGDSFDIFDFSSLTGQLDAVQLPSLGAGLVWDQSMLYATGVLDVVQAADLDADGDVDDADFGLAFAAFTGPGNGPSSNPAADLDGDDDVDDADFGIAFAAFTGPGAVVPEPAALAIFGWVGLTLARRRRLQRC